MHTSFSTFIDSFVSFDFSFLQVFGHLLDPRSFHSLEGPLIHRHASLPINFKGIRLISITTIAPTTYLRSWAFVASIKIAKIMVNQHPLVFKL
jgi:hypothetical protein